VKDHHEHQISRETVLILESIKTLSHQLHKFMKTQSELAADLRASLTQLQKTVTEIKGVQDEVNTLKAKITELEAALAAAVSTGGAPLPELADAVQAVKDQTQVVDDAIPDAPAVPAPQG
jgi:chromosome segregation ATPase